MRLHDIPGVDGAVAEFSRAKGERALEGGASSLVCAQVQPRRIADIPPRPWAYGHFLMFGHVAAIGAVDGGGKGAMAVAIAASMITGRELLGERVWRPGPVAVVTYEDDETEWERRIAAICLHYDLDYDTVIAGFHFIKRPGGRVEFAARSASGIAFPDGDTIIERLREIGAALLIIDPFNHAHTLEDGNNNVQIAQVAGEIARIARDSNVAALVLHHLRKGSDGSADDLMGATSLRATFRACRILQRMSSDEAEKLGLPPRQAWRYSRIAGTKENYAPPPEFGTWYKLESVPLDNGSDLYTEGDNLQATTTWSPPSPFAGISRTQIAAIFEGIRSGPGDGEFYSPDRRSKRWAGALIVKVTEKTEDEAARILRTWTEKKVLTKNTYDSPERREPVGCFIVNEMKAKEMTGPLYNQGE